ncbi:hypothetical protein GGR21_000669 [Dysgonomonas hofstadii]|uniref:Prophage antirepressor n=1 Tax=Dysgonomonas hofstadii TaxID=637886 RepID=A0A840CQD6_9BACT|nr:virulence RhuM family protein [Dysgonomonas hofstadii]MBB4034782.1 hypothetical protein [Dysgonomonas hofstadii]
MENRRIIISDDGMVIVSDEVKMNIGEIADLFGIYYRTAKQHIRSIEKAGITTGDNTMGGSVERMKVYPDYYGLEMIIAIAFRVQSPKAVVFRKWIQEKIVSRIGRKSIRLIEDWRDQNFSLN